MRKLDIAVKWWNNLTYAGASKYVHRTSVLTGIENPEHFLGRDKITSEEVYAIFNAVKTIK